jgi:hypothetical protein
MAKHDHALRAEFQQLLDGRHGPLQAQIMPLVNRTLRVYAHIQIQTQISLVFR